jgi:hypothetical protein
MAIGEASSLRPLTVVEQQSQLNLFGRGFDVTAAGRFEYQQDCLLPMFAAAPGRPDPKDIGAGIIKRP